MPADCFWAKNSYNQMWYGPDCPHVLVGKRLLRADRRVRNKGACVLVGLLGKGVVGEYGDGIEVWMR